MGSISRTPSSIAAAALGMGLRLGHSITSVGAGGLSGNCIKRLLRGSLILSLPFLSAAPSGWRRLLRFSLGLLFEFVFVEQFALRIAVLADHHRLASLFVKIRYPMVILTFADCAVTAANRRVAKDAL